MGYPDYQGYAQWRGLALVTGTHNIPVGETDLGVFLVNNYASLRVLFSPSAGSQQLLISYFEDEAQTIETGSFSVFAGPLTIVDCFLPNLGTWVDISILNSGTVSHSSYLSIAPSNIPVGKPTYHAPANNIASGLTTIGAGVTQTYQPEFVSPGPATLFFQPGGTAGDMDVNMLGGTGSPVSGTLIFQQLGPTTNQNSALQIPDTPIQIQVVNNGAVSHTYRLSFIPTV